METIMLTVEQRQRLEELQGIETLNEEQIKELETLNADIPADPAQDDFDAEWDELDGKKPKEKPAAKTAEEIEKEEKEKAEKEALALKEKEKSQSNDSTNTDGDILNTAPVDSDTQPDSTKEKKPTDPRDLVIEEMNQKMKSWDGRIKAAENRAAAAEQKLKDAEAKGKDKKVASDISPDEDDAELGKFFKEYPDLEGPIKKVAERMATKIFNDKIGNKLETLETNQASAQVTADKKADSDHMATINAAHSDWEKIYDSGALHTWIERQPGYLQPRLTDILKTGSADEVIGLFTSYKKAAGKSKDTSTNSVSSKKQAKASEMEAVPASTGGPKEGTVKITKDDFDGAWDDLEKKDEKQK
jgi:hypothetical protein